MNSKKIRLSKEAKHDDFLQRLGYKSLKVEAKKRKKKHALRKCLKCQKEGKWRYLCPKCIELNNNTDCGMLPEAYATLHFNHTGGKS